MAKITITLDTVTGKFEATGLPQQPQPDPQPQPQPQPDPKPDPQPQGDVRQTATATLSGSKATLTGSWQNLGGAAVPVQKLIIAVREPGATHASGPFDMDATVGGSQLDPSKPIVGNAERTLSKPGKWTFYPTYQTADGTWHDGGEVSVTVAADQPAPNPQPQPDPQPNPGTGGLKHAMKARLGAQPWQADWGGSNMMSGTGTSLDPKFVADYKALGMTVLRAMDAIPVNNSNVKTWAQRVSPTGKQSSPGIAIEHIINAANQIGADLWMCIPLQADDDYIRQCANLLKTKLNPELRVFAELSNEVWNGGFTQTQQAMALGAAAGLPGNQWYQGIGYLMQRSLQMFALYQEVFGNAAMGSKVIRVIAESGNLDLYTQALANVYKSTKYNAGGQKIDMLAVAPYVGNGTSGSAETLDRFKSEAQKQAAEYLDGANKQKSQYGIPYVGIYEFGQHHLQNAQAFAQNKTLAQQAYTYMLDLYASKCNAPMVLYTSHGTWQSGGAWGLLQKVGDSIDSSGKASAVRDWTASHK